MKTISTKGIELLKKLEGERLTAYRDTGNKWTIGVGHLIQAHERYLLGGIDQNKSTELLRNDLSLSITAVNDSIKIPLLQSQIDALIILAFNIGNSAFKNSQLVQMINSGRPGNEIFSRWVTHYVTAGGIKSEGLETRRKIEASLFLTSPDIYNTEKQSEWMIPIVAIGIISFLLLKYNK